MAARRLQAGDPAPAFSLTAGDGREVRLTDLAGRWVVLYFYPKDDTPGCTKEACAFRDSRAAFAKTGAVVLGVSGDDAASHQRFAAKYDLTFPLLSDPGFAVAKRYGAYKQKWLYGRSFLGIERSTFVIDPQGRLAAVFPRVQVNGHAEAVLEALRGAAAAAPACAR
jgi:peroxiredoxin Q/BCP